MIAEISPDSLRLAVFLGLLVTLIIAEVILPWRDDQQRLMRWPSNFAIVVLSSLLARLVVPVTAVAAALMVQTKGTGLFHSVNVPFWLALVASVFLLDLAIYGQHVLFHKVPVLWRLHRMHHADVMLDVSSGFRFHPLEIVLSLVIKLVVVTALGAPPEAVLVFEILLNATSMFNHANIRLPVALDRLIRFVIVTPDMHRVHHSVVRHETDSNYGFNLPWWDWLFGTYRNEPEAGRDGVVIGLETFRDPAESRIDRLLTQPFRNDSAPH